MKFAKYAARVTKKVNDQSGGSFSLFARGWSDQSQEEALIDASKRLERLLNNWNSKKSFSSHSKSEYPYPDTPVCEEVVQEIPQGIITRNSYGSLVLNSANCLFIDVDIQNKSTGFLSKLLGKKSAQSEFLDKLDTWTNKNKQSIQAYQTAAGLRLLVLSEPFVASDLRTDGILEELNADPLYRKLCKTQDCFRARLTPKFWRCKGTRPPLSYPWPNLEYETRFRTWETKYSQLIKGYNTCRSLGQFGSARALPEILNIKDIHDSYTIGTNDKLPLA